ncbi:MAG: hypothetical protein QM485_07950 [Flavobacteriaceae bacterium]
MIVHREYTNAQPATFIIYRDRVETENANNQHGEGVLSPTNFSPFPKNPSIAKFFMQLGRFDELGSGILNVNKYIKAYSGKDNPQFIEGATFKTIIPVKEALLGAVVGVHVGAIVGAVDGAFVGVTKGVKEKLKAILKAISEEEGKRIPFYKSAADLDESDRTIERYMQQLREANLIEFKGEASQTGGYYLTDKFKKTIEPLKQ